MLQTHFYDGLLRRIHGLGGVSWQEMAVLFVSWG